MNDIIGNVAQELADHLDDLRDTEHGVTDYDGDARSFPVTGVGDAEVDMGLGTVFSPSVSFLAVVGGQLVRVRVTIETELAMEAGQCWKVTAGIKHGDSHSYSTKAGKTYRCEGLA